MNNSEIEYERNLTGSFMKIKAPEKESFDEKIMLRQKPEGTISVEKCFWNGEGQFWYNITGMQPLDAYCKVKEIDFTFIERLLTSLCAQVERLEWSMISSDCIEFDPNFIFISNSTEEFYFMIYPTQEEAGIHRILDLMEYLLTKIDHKNADTVQKTYRLYELMSDRDWTIVDIKHFLRETKEETLRQEIKKEAFAKGEASAYGEAFVKRDTYEMRETPIKKERYSVEVAKLPEKSRKQKLQEKWHAYWTKKLEEYLPEKLVKKIVHKAKEKPTPIVFYPEDDIDEPEDHEEYIADSYPTVCITLQTSVTEGILYYEGNDGFNNIAIGDEEIHVGKGKNVNAQIGKETVSHLHARVWKESGAYYIEDLNSTNGTFLNGEMLTFHSPKCLSKNDEVLFADVKYRFA